MVTASVVLYETEPEDLKGLVDSVLNSSIDQLFVVDHSSTDKLRCLLPDDGRLTYLKLKNRGYGAGNNRAIEEACKIGSEFHLVVNPDVRWIGDVIVPLKEYMSEHPDVGLMMPKILYPNGEIQHQTKLLPSPFDLFVRRFLPSKYFKRRLEKFEMRRSGFTKIMNVPYLSGSFMFLRMSVLKKTGAFDERFFMYPEDIDLTRRIHREYLTLFYPEVSIYHKLARESHKNPRLFALHIVNMIRYFNKWGWFIDPERDSFNKRAIEDYGL